jgi:hypothetical protein
MEVFKLLEKTNCRKCNEKTCLAFAAAVFGGVKPLSDCPFVQRDLLEQYGVQEKRISNFDQDFQNFLQSLPAKLQALDFSATAERIGGNFSGSRLTFKIMGKDFGVDRDGKFFTDIHINPWVIGPTLTYILRCKGRPVENQWVPLRELPHGVDWHRFFSQQCEKPLKQLADTYTDLFEDLVQIFNGKQVENHYQSDVAVVLHPLPLVPMLICYWKPEEGMESDLNLFFDATAEENLGIEELYSIGTGIVSMFTKISQRHGV